MTYQPPPPPPSMPPPPPGWGSAPQRIPGQVNTAAILLFISGGFSILGGLLLFALGSIGAVFVLVGIVVIAIGAFEIYVGVQLRKLVSWARIAAIVLAGIGALFSLISLIKGSYTSIVGLALDLVIIYLLMQQDSVRAFETSGR